MVVDVVELAGLLVLPAFLIADLFWRDKAYEAPSFWRGRAALVTLGNSYLAGYVAAFWGGAFAGRTLFDLSGLGMVTGAAVGILGYQLTHYGYHRLAHEWGPLWRLHQMHHAAESVDAFGAFYLHPIDNVFFTTAASVVLFPVLGLSVEAGVLASVFLTVNAVVQHANIKTPHWLGYVIQRPESHRIHHGRGVHRYNYADLPLVDMLFGTFRNPKAEPGLKAGFSDGASAKLWPLLLGKDVSGARSAPRTADRSREMAGIA